MSPFVDTRPLVYTPEELAEQQAKRRAVVLSLFCVLISVMLSVGVIATLFMALR